MIELHYAELLYECNAAKRTKAYRNYWMAFVCIIFTESIGCASAVLLRYEMLFENVLFSTHTHSKIPIRRMSKPCQITAFFGEMQLGNQCKGTKTYFRCHRVEFDSEIGIFALVPQQQQQQQRRCFSIKWQWPNHGHGAGGIISASAYGCVHYARQNIKNISVDHINHPTSASRNWRTQIHLPDVDFHSVQTRTSHKIRIWPSIHKCVFKFIPLIYPPPHHPPNCSLSWKRN